MNKRQLGIKTEKEAEQLLQGLGYTTHRNGIGSRWQKNRDIFHLFDIVALLKKGEQGLNGYTEIFLQVKSNKSDYYKARIDVGLFIAKHKLRDKGTLYGVILKQTTPHSRAKWRLCDCQKQDKYSDIYLYEKEMIE